MNDQIAASENPVGTALYGLFYRCWDACQDADDPYGRSPDHRCYIVTTFPVTKTTATRIYFRVVSGTEMQREKGYFIARAAFNADGKAYHRGLAENLYLSPPEIQSRPQPKTVAQLRREMADAHPDRGGDRHAFQLARARYLAAKARPA